jgi:hypothetical protein
MNQFSEGIDQRLSIPSLIDAPAASLNIGSGMDRS